MIEDGKKRLISLLNADGVNVDGVNVDDVIAEGANAASSFSPIVLSRSPRISTST
ncbi:MAG: hypothetical protein ABF889_06345 [Bifidobacterium sp.]|uniref:Uncharacterized protein n=1 Tax=Bifidobacterium fermentum TaxID=3059035 RepID=A0AB39UKH4_9BIFI